MSTLDKIQGRVYKQASCPSCITIDWGCFAAGAITIEHNLHIVKFICLPWGDTFSKETAIFNIDPVLSTKLLRRIFLAMLSALSFASCGSSVSNKIFNGSNAFVPYPPFASRTSGVAPLSVFFDAAGMTFPGVTKPFHHLQYTWDFGDGVKNSQWTNGASGSTLAVKTCSSAINVPGCKNYATGGVAAHVYETAGSYTATLTVTDGLGNSTSQTFPITVASASTLGTPYCFYTTVALNSGICSGNEHLSTGTFQSDLAAAVTAGSKYILFKQGDYSESATSGYTLSVTGPGLIGSYGTGALPLITEAIHSGTYPTMLGITKADWRLMDLNIQGDGTINAQGIIPATETTILRVTTGNIQYAVNVPAASTYTTVQDCTFGNANTTGNTGSSYGVYSAADHAILLGNYMSMNLTQSHDIRLDPSNYFVIENSTQVGGTGGNTGQSLDAFTVRANSSYGEISDNLIENYDATIQPQNSTSIENQHDIVVERNFFDGAVLQLQSNNITVRNNIFTVNAASVNDSAISIAYQSTVGSPMPTALEIYNNSVYDNITDTAPGVLITSASTVTSACTATLANNLVYDTVATTPHLILQNGACVITGINGTYGNSSDSQISSTSPLWTNGTTTYSKPSDFNLGASSYALSPGTGNGNETGGQTSTTVPLWTDFFGTVRQTPPTAYDAGAVKH